VDSQLIVGVIAKKISDDFIYLKVKLSLG